MKVIAQIFLAVVFSIIFVVICVVTINSFLIGSDNYIENSEWVDGIGTLIELDQGEGSSSKIRYSYNNMIYEEFGLQNISVNGAIIGEKYKIKLNPKKPQYFLPRSWQPVFLESEKSTYTTCEVVRIGSNFIFHNKPDVKSTLSFYSVIFKYSVNGIEYSREQNLPPEFSKENTNIKVGNKYYLQYWIENPQRAIIHLDEPLKE